MSRATGTTTMDAKLLERLHAIDWSLYNTAYGSALNVPDQLQRLLRGGKEAIAASHDLWCGLCHQHAFVSSAALPALPFILEALGWADEALTVEILDILLGFASCTRPGFADGFAEGFPWVDELRLRVAEYLPRLRELSGHANVEIADFAQLIIEDLDAGECLLAM